MNFFLKYNGLILYNYFGNSMLTEKFDFREILNLDILDDPDPTGFKIRIQIRPHGPAPDPQPCLEHVHWQVYPLLAELLFTLFSFEGRDTLTLQVYKQWGEEGRGSIGVGRGMWYLHSVAFIWNICFCFRFLITLGRLIWILFIVKAGFQFHGRIQIKIPLWM